MFNGFTNALRKKRELIQRQKNSVQKIEEHREKIRNLFNIQTANAQKNLSNPIVGVDSAFAISRQILGNFYISIPVVVLIGNNGVNVSDMCYVEEDGVYLDSVLSAISLGGELLLASDKLDKCSYIFLDGSISTFILTLANGINTALEHKGSAVANHLLKIYPDVIYALKNILTSSKAVFVPKSSQKYDLKDSILRSIKLPEIEYISDYGIVMFILEKSEYIKVGTAKMEKYKFNKEWIKDQALYNTLNKVEELAQSPNIYYMRGLSGHPFKFECFGRFPSNIALSMTIDKEFHITHDADLEAKDRIQPILVTESAYEEGVRL